MVMLMLAVFFGLIIYCVVIVHIYDSPSSNAEKGITEVSDEDMKRISSKVEKADRLKNMSCKDLDAALNLIIKHKDKDFDELLEIQQCEQFSSQSISDPEVMMEVYSIYSTMKSLISDTLNQAYFSKCIDLEYNLFLQTIDKVRNHIKSKAKNDIILNDSKYFQIIDQIAAKMTELYGDFLFVGAFQELVNTLYKDESNNA